MPASIYSFPQRKPGQTYANPVTQGRVSNMYSRYADWNKDRPAPFVAPKQQTPYDFYTPSGQGGYGVPTKPPPAIQNNPFAPRNSPIPPNWMDMVNQAINKTYQSANPWFKK